jgi:hypothetical protein
MIQRFIFWCVVIVIVIAFVDNPAAFGAMTHAFFGFLSKAGSAVGTFAGSL